MNKFRVVVELDHTEATDPASIVSTSTAIIQQSFAQVPGVGLVGVTEVVEEEVTV